jgi:threonine dehydratase
VDLPNFDDVAAAAARIAAHVVHTPMLRSTILDGRTGGTILIKAEPLQRTGSFKFRGATNAVLQLTQAQREAGVVTHSSGNHGQALACAAASAGVAATIHMPSDAPAIKVDSTRAWGATILPFDRATTDREALGRDWAAKTGATLIPPFDYAPVIAGQGSVALELIADARDSGLTMDDLLVCTGGGGLIAGCALAASGASPGTIVHPVEPAGWDDTARSLAAGERLANPPGGSTLCDALLAKAPGELTFAINQRLLGPGIAVTDDEVLAAMAFAFRYLKLVVEPGGAVCLAALLAGRFDARGRVVGIVLSGGNVDPATFARALSAPALAHT